MKRAGDYQIIEQADHYQIYRWDGRGWLFLSNETPTTESGVKVFIAARGLALVEESKIGIWPARNYRGPVRMSGQEGSPDP